VSTPASAVRDAAGTWPGSIQYRTDAPADLVSSFPAADQLTAVVVTPTAPALVLGSAQRAESIDAAAADAAGLPRVRRRSGGGGVIVRPGAQLWLDVFVPAGHRLAHHDTGKAALVIGRLWADALAPLLSQAPEVHDGAMVVTPWSRAVCFSGTGPGEVLLGGRKLVGVSQRRDRSGAWFFSMAHVTFDPTEHAAVLAIDPGERAGLVAQLAADVTTLPVPPEAAQTALLAAVRALGTPAP
jgi:lipoate-protein ligase A